MHLCGKTFLQKGARPAKAENAAYREQGVKTFAGQEQKMVIYWQTKAAVSYTHLDVYKRQHSKSA